MMKAVIRSGGSMLFNENYAKPKCSPNNVIVKMKAAAINPVDYKMGWPILGKIVGIDFAGTIEETGNNVQGFNVGDEVYGSCEGSLAEFAAVDPKRMAFKPKTASFVEAASLPVAYLTSLQSLRAGKVSKDSRVLIIGASGGCGVAGIQIARAMGAKEVIAVCSGKNADLVKGLGATDVIDYTQTDITSYCLDGADTVKEEAKFDAIYDAASYSGAGEDYKDASLKLLKLPTDTNGHGQYVAINGSPLFWIRGLTIGLPANQHLLLMKPTTEDFDYLSNLIDNGWEEQDGSKRNLKAIIDQILPFTEEAVSKGFELLKSRRAKGKIVFDFEKQV